MGIQKVVLGTIQPEHRTALARMAARRQASAELAQALTRALADMGTAVALEWNATMDAVSAYLPQVKQPGAQVDTDTGEVFTNQVVDDAPHGHADDPAIQQAPPETADAQPAGDPAPAPEPPDSGAQPAASEVSDAPAAGTYTGEEHRVGAADRRVGQTPFAEGQVDARVSNLVDRRAAPKPAEQLADEVGALADAPAGGMQTQVQP